MRRDESEGTWTRCMIVAVFWMALFLLLIGNIAYGGAPHEAGHNEYLGWASQKTGNCCNNQDCQGLSEDEWREGPEGAEVKIKEYIWTAADGRYKYTGEEFWCKVEQQHFIVHGKSPNGETAHACIRKYADKAGKEATCNRLLCFVGPMKM